MTSNLDEAIEVLLLAALPGLLGGETPPVTITVTSSNYEIDPQSAEGFASAPRPDDRIDHFSYDPEAPPEFFTLTQPPYPGPKRVYLTTTTNDRIALRSGEALWDGEDNRVFSLQINPIRDLTDVNGVEILYGITAVFTTLKAEFALTIVLQQTEHGSDEQLEQAEALASAVIELNRQALIDNSTAEYNDGDYTATVSVKNFKMTQGTAPAANQRELHHAAEIEMKASRSLRDDEGQPIEYICTPGKPVTEEQPVNIDIGIMG